MRCLLFFLCASSIFAQDNYEFVGAVKLNDSAFISYKLVLQEVDGTLSGFSVTDMAGPHETKSYVSGYFDDQADEIEFYESGIVYTKSFFIKEDFCYVHFKGRLKKLNDRQNIVGGFEGLYSNGDPCLSGELNLMSYGKILKRAKRLDRRIDRNLFVSKEKKEKINLTRTLDTLSMNIIAKGETLSIFSEDKQVTLTIFDAGKEDGDRVNVLVNNTLVLEDYTVTKQLKSITIPLETEKTTIVIKALNAGLSPPNTIKVEILDNKNLVKTLTNLAAGETAGVTIIHK